MSRTIPALKTCADFRVFSQAGRDLAYWHLNYETVACHPSVAIEETVAAPAEPERRYRVTKMKFAKTKDPVSNKNVNDKTTVIYNEFITLKNIPLAAYDYIVNGKPALEWVMERQSVTTDKDSGQTFARELRYPATPSPRIYGEIAKASNLPRIALPGFSHAASFPILKVKIRSEIVPTNTTGLT